LLLKQLQVLKHHLQLLYYVEYNYLHQSMKQTYQDFQAIQVAENQAQRQFLGLACEHLIQQNDLTFRVQCENERVIVRYPMGEISIKTK